MTHGAPRKTGFEPLAMGYDSFLVKPLQPANLVRLLRSYANGAR